MLEQAVQEPARGGLGGGGGHDEAEGGGEEERCEVGGGEHGEGGEGGEISCGCDNCPYDTDSRSPAAAIYTRRVIIVIMSS